MGNREISVYHQEKSPQCGERESSYTVDGNVRQCSHYGKQGFSNESSVASGGQNTGASVSVLPMNIQGGSPEDRLV